MLDMLSLHRVHIDNINVQVGREGDVHAAEDHCQAAI
jgi:hypothetical protein